MAKLTRLLSVPRVAEMARRPSRLSDGERGQSGELLLMCARICGTNLRSCIQCSQGLATACSGCSGLGQDQSAEECIPAPSQVGSLQGASVMVLENLECNLSEGACFTDPSYAYLGKLQGQVSGQSAEVYPLFFHACNALVLV